MFNFHTLPANVPRGAERKFDVFKRESNGHVHRVGKVLAVNKVQADTKAHRLWRPNTAHREAVWCEEQSEEPARVAA